MSSKLLTNLSGKKQIGNVIRYLDYQRSITGNVDGDNYAGFYIDNVPGAKDEPSFHVAKSILKRLQNEGYIKFDHTTNIKEYNNFCVVEFLPKYKWIKLKYFFTINLWEITNPLWLIWNFIKIAYFLIIILWRKSKILTSIIGFILTILGYDWVEAWQNIEMIFNF